MDTGADGDMFQRQICERSWKLGCPWRVLLAWVRIGICAIFIPPVLGIEGVEPSEFLLVSVGLFARIGVADDRCKNVRMKAIKRRRLCNEGIVKHGVRSE